VPHHVRGPVRDFRRCPVLEVYSSIAYGADTLAVETARAVELPVHLVLPKPVMKQDDGSVDTKSGFAADFWEKDASGEFVRFRTGDWERTLKQITDAESGIGGGTLRLTHGSQNQPECYYDTCLDILECCDVLVAVWDGKKSRGLGGTAQMVVHARKLALPILLIDSNIGTITRERPERFAVKDDAGCKLIKDVDVFSRSYADIAGGPDETTDEIFGRLEACSNKESEHFRGYLVRIITIHGCATFVAAVACILPHDSAFWKAALAVLALSEFCMVAWALWQTKRLNRHDIHQRWMKTRFATELLRAMKTFGGLLDPTHPLVGRHERAWHRFAVTLGLMLHREHGSPSDWRSARDDYVASRLRHPDMRIGQIKYFTEKQALAEPHFHRTVRWGSALTTAAFLFVLGAFLYKTRAWLTDTGHGLPTALELTHGWTWRAASADVAFRLMPISLPLAAGVFISLRSALDSGRRTYRYQELAKFLDDSANHLEALQTEASVRRAVAATEEVLLDELIEWHLAEQQNGAH